ncbi:MAG: hypothetical protein LBT45_01090 [Rickettsiales bacterium]|jgi:hypothetical protein|nr:hypothetical protein [Rickettsiales bacterium]
MAQDTDNFARKVLDKYLRHIVDDVFMAIRTDDDTRNDFMNLAATRARELGTAGHEMADELHKDIKASIKKLLDLDDVRINRHPESRMVDSYMEHKLKERPASKSAYLIE